MQILLSKWMQTNENHIWLFKTFLFNKSAFYKRNHKLPRFCCSYSIEINKLLKFPAPNP